MQIFSRYLRWTAGELFLPFASYHSNKTSCMPPAKPLQEWSRSSQRFTRNFHGKDPVATYTCQEKVERTPLLQRRNVVSWEMLEHR